jgi:hypothetical protein
MAGAGLTGTYVLNSDFGSDLQRFLCATIMDEQGEIRREIGNHMRLRALSMAVSTMALAACYKSIPQSGQCKNEHVQEMFSQDRQWKSVVFIRDCPGSGSAFQVSVLPAAAPAPTEAGNAFRQDTSAEQTGGHSHQLQQVWKGDRELWISHDQQMKVVYSVSEVGVITIVHTTENILKD